MMKYVTGVLGDVMEEPIFWDNINVQSDPVHLCDKCRNFLLDITDIIRGAVNLQQISQVVWRYGIQRHRAM